jgi:hypothetical protein
MLAAAEARADEANKRADAAVALAERALTQLAAAAARADRAEEATARRGAAIQAELDGARAEARAAQDAARRLEATDTARQARGRWARLRVAWRGE